MAEEAFDRDVWVRAFHRLDLSDAFGGVDERRCVDDLIREPGPRSGPQGSRYGRGPRSSEPVSDTHL